MEAWGGGGGGTWKDDDVDEHRDVPMAYHDERTKKHKNGSP